MSLLIGEYIRQMPYILSRANLQSESYNNCLIIQKCVRDMDSQGLLTEFEKLVLQGVFEGYTYTEISDKHGVNRKRVVRTFKTVSDRIAFMLGDEFSDSHLVLQNYSRRQL